jgi:hypothetical protein
MLLASGLGAHSMIYFGEEEARVRWSKKIHFHEILYSATNMVIQFTDSPR